MVLKPAMTFCARVERNERVYFSFLTGRSAATVAGGSRPSAPRGRQAARAPLIDAELAPPLGGPAGAASGAPTRTRRPRENNEADRCAWDGLSGPATATWARPLLGLRPPPPAGQESELQVPWGARESQPVVEGVVPGSGAHRGRRGPAVPLLAGLGAS